MFLRASASLAVAALLLPAAATRAAAPLPALGVQAQGMTVSGLSSGGYMAVQFHLAHSTSVSGAGVLAGGPWDCAEGSARRALRNCMSPTAEAPVPSAGESVAHARNAAATKRIDPLDGLAGDRVWLYSGGNDHTVSRPVVDALAVFYRNWISATDLRYLTPADPGHAMPSQDDPAANACATSEPPYINRCDQLDGPGELLAHLLGSLNPKAPTAAGELLAFDQRPHARAAGAWGMGATAYVYVPTGCRSGGCRLHVAFHGCRQSADQIGQRYVRDAGYNRWAESNQVVVLYPQTTPRHGWSPTLPPHWTFNPLACWDWWGYENGDYLSRQAPQIRAVRAMVERLEGAASQR